MQTSDLFDPSPSEDTRIACDVTVLDDPERHQQVYENLFEDREEFREVDGGVAIRFPGATHYAEQILRFVNRERKCCPFLTFEIAIEPEEQGTWLYMGGDERVEEYLTKSYEL